MFIVEGTQAPMDNISSHSRPRASGRGSVTFSEDAIKKDELLQAAAGADGNLVAVPSPPRNPRLGRAARSMGIGSDAYIADSYVQYEGESRPHPRATSGSEAIIDIDPATAKTVEVYGFVGWITTFLAWICYLLWAYLPESVLHQVGVSYYPNKYWAVAAPALLVTMLLLEACTYGGIGLSVNPHVDSFESLADGYSKPYVLPSKPTGISNLQPVSASGSRKGSPLRPGSAAGAVNVDGMSSDVGGGVFSPHPGFGRALQQQQDAPDAGGGTRGGATCAECGSHTEAAAAQQSAGQSSAYRRRGGSSSSGVGMGTAGDDGGGGSGGATSAVLSSPLRPTSGGMRSAAGAAGILSGSPLSAVTGVAVSASPSNSPVPRSRGGTSEGGGSSAAASILGASTRATGSGRSPGQQHLPGAPALLPPLVLTIDKTMPTPEIGDVPVTLVNRIQFGYHRSGRRRRERVASSVGQ